MPSFAYDQLFYCVKDRFFQRRKFNHCNMELIVGLWIYFSIHHIGVPFSIESLFRKGTDQFAKGQAGIRKFMHCLQHNSSKLSHTSTHLVFKRLMEFSVVFCQPWLRWCVHFEAITINRFADGSRWKSKCFSGPLMLPRYAQGKLQFEMFPAIGIEQCCSLQQRTYLHLR